MSTFHHFEEIIAWQECRKLSRKIRTVCKQHNVRRDYPFVDQITRSTRSISANIAEGSDSLSVPEFIKFLGYAKRSAAEVRSHLYDALDEKYISHEEFDDMNNQIKYIGNMIGKLVIYLGSLDQNRKRIPPTRKHVNP